MANGNIAANFRIVGTFQYKDSASPRNYPASPIGAGNKVAYLVSGSGALVATKGHQVILLNVPAGSTAAFDLANLTDVLLATGIVWADIKVIHVQHDPGSLSSGVQITGAVANAIPGLRMSNLKAGQQAVPFFDPSGTGLAFTSPNSQVIFTNNDGVNAAKVNVWILGE
jgi:hypothetical protein